MKVELITGAYQARSLIASCQRCVNLYVEKNPENEEFPATLYPTPGLVTRATASAIGWRCLYTASNGDLYGVVGSSVVFIAPDFTITVLGTISSASGPCHMADNTTSLVLVDGSPNGWTIVLATKAFAQILDPAFYGSSRIDYVDGYFLFNRPGTRQWYISLINQVAFDPLDFASKSGAVDSLVAVAVTTRNVFLFGENTTEIWTNSGASAFTFSRVEGAFIQFGCAAAHSIWQADGSLYWLSRSEQGACMVMRTVNYGRERLSTFAIEHEFQTYARVDDAIGFIHQMEGHYWYVLTFPTANKTWVFDVATQEWHERAYLESTEALSRHRASCFALWNGRQMMGDYQTGALYEMTSTAFTDAGNPIRRIRSFPHMADDGNRVVYKQFKAAMQMGDTGYTQIAEIRLRWSDSKGASWGTPLSATLGSRGEYLTDCRFLRLGMARSRVFELSWSADSPTALNGAYIQTQAAAS